VSSAALRVPLFQGDCKKPPRDSKVTGPGKATFIAPRCHPASINCVKLHVPGGNVLGLGHLRIKTGLNRLDQLSRLSTSPRPELEAGSYAVPRSIPKRGPISVAAGAVSKREAESPGAKRKLPFVRLIHRSREGEHRHKPAFFGLPRAGRSARTRVRGLEEQSNSLFRGRRAVAAYSFRKSGGDRRI